MKRLLAALLAFTAAWTSSPARAGLTLNLRFTDSSTTRLLTQADVGTMIPIQIWATIDKASGVNGSGNKFGLQYVFYSVASKTIANLGSTILGELEGPAIVAPFNGAGSQFGQLADFNGDGIGDLGSAPTSTSNINYALPRALSANFVESNANSFEFLVETVNFHVHSLPASPGQARGEIRFLPVLGNFNGIPRTANWWQQSSGVVNDGANNDSQFLFNGAGVSFLTSASPWTNVTQPLDVNNDAKITPQDVLAIIDEINLRGSRTLPSPNLDFHPPPFYDVTGDGLITPLDALQVIDALNKPGGPLVAGNLGVVSVPEPSGLFLAGVAALALGVWSGRRMIHRPSR